MSEPTARVQATADAAIATPTLTPTVADPAIATPSADPTAPPTVVASEVKDESVGAAPAAPTVAASEVKDEYAGLPTLPAFAIEYAPIVWLENKEKYWQGNPLDHIKNCLPQTKEGEQIDVPPEILGTYELLKHPKVNQKDCFLTLTKDPKRNSEIEELTNYKGRPDKNGWSESTVWIIVVDKKKACGEGVVDVFYFYFYPYNLGNTVAFKKFGNHVGDWEHSMVRFRNGKPIALHLSAHADGHSWDWKTVEKEGDRPVGYVATGSHALYGKPGKKLYSVASFVGPIDHTSKDVRWDPILNYCATKYDLETETFSVLAPPNEHPSTTSATTSSSVPSYASSSSIPGPITSSGTTRTPTTKPTYNTLLSPLQILSVVEFLGHWGNSFHEVEEKRKKSRLGDVGDAFHQLLDSDPVGDKLSKLTWAEGPVGPRYKSLERVGVTWNTTALLRELV